VKHCTPSSPQVGPETSSGHGQALETLSPQQAERLAFHFVKAGEVDRGVGYAQAAGEHALQAHAPAEAVRYYQQAAELIATRPDDPRTAKLLLSLGEAHTRTGDFDAAVTSFRSAAVTAQRDGALALAAEAWRCLGGVRWRQEQLLTADDQVHSTTYYVSGSPLAYLEYGVVAYSSNGSTSSNGSGVGVTDYDVGY
jgi:hypothetical protein